MPNLNAYMAYSKYEGTEGGCILVFAKDEQRAKEMALEDCLNAETVEDIAVDECNFTSHLALIERVNLERDIPCVVDCPIHCEACKEWGHGIDVNMNCCGCGKPPGEPLLWWLAKYYLANNYIDGDKQKWDELYKKLRYGD
ncbi:MAG: hypothetical protein GY928_35530 [Colwellia sp.]|nr:hypothetical protein [Colwellia sp.]